jgi:hypothetical protein
MTNARCLTEGVDVPAIDCVVFADWFGTGRVAKPAFAGRYNSFPILPR